MGHGGNLRVIGKILVSSQLATHRTIVVATQSLKVFIEFLLHTWLCLKRLSVIFASETTTFLELNLNRRASTIRKERVMCGVAEQAV